jgi:Rhodopirellula transposase DDE domain
MQDTTCLLDDLVRSAAKRLTGFRRRSFMAEVASRLCDGSARKAERRFGWARGAVETGLHEAGQGIRCVENFSARGRPRSEEADPRLAADIRSIVEPFTQADPELKSSRQYSNVSAAEVRRALVEKGHDPLTLPGERTMRDILNRMNYRLKRIRKAKPLKKVAATDAVFANLKATQEQSRADPKTLEVSVDTKAKVAVGDYARGGKNQDRLDG